MDGYSGITSDNWSGGIDFSDGANENNNRVFSPFNFPAILEQTAEQAYPLVLESAGASIVRDEIDARIVNEVISGTTTFSGSVSGDPGLIDSQDDVGGVPVHYSFDPPLDSDRDGMPDFWEAQYNFDLNNPENSEDKVETLHNPNIETLVFSSNFN